MVAGIRVGLPAPLSLCEDARVSEPNTPPSEPERVETETFPPTAPIGCRTVLWMMVFAVLGFAALIASLKPITPPVEGGTQLRYTLGDREVASKVASQIERRLNTALLPARAEPAASDVLVFIEGEHADSRTVAEVQRVIGRPGVLSFQLVVDEASSGFSAKELDAEKERIARAQESPGFDPAREKWDLVWSHEGRLLLEKPGVPGTLIANADRSMDSMGRPAVGFEFSTEGGKVFYEFTGTHINRRLAIVLDGKVMTAPVIRSAISQRGIIEGGTNGFSEAEVTSIVAELKCGPLAAKPTFASSSEVFLQVRPRPYAIGVGALAALLVFATALAPVRGRAWVRTIQLALVALVVVLVWRHVPLWQLLGQK